MSKHTCNVICSACAAEAGAVAGDPTAELRAWISAGRELFIDMYGSALDAAARELLHATRSSQQRDALLDDLHGVGTALAELLDGVREQLAENDN